MKDFLKMLRNLFLLILLIAAAVFAFLYGWDNIMSNDSTPTPPANTDGAYEWVVPSDAQTARITHIHDGDTLFLEATESGDHIFTEGEIKVRLIGIDTPEVSSPKECYADEASTALRNLAPVNSTVWVATDRDPYDRYDRMLLYLWNESGIFVNMEMVAGGYAEAIRVQPNDSYYTDLKAAENTAYNEALGMWGACSY